MHFVFRHEPIVEPVVFGVVQVVFFKDYFGFSQSTLASASCNESSSPGVFRCGAQLILLMEEILHHLTCMKP